ncbi:MAG: glycosyltransferase family 2 protein, partial [Sandaracinaceae bacterium]|nr:glycosyltransferase family 2 protein [Sandaracinaceae bacterium]
GAPLVSIVVPTRDRLDLLHACLASLERSTHPHREVVIVDNGSIERETLAFLAACPHRVLRIDEPYNFSRLNGRAVREACTGAQLLFLNNDTQVIAPDWIEALLEHAQREGVGAAGAKLLYPDGRLQHAGLVYTRTRFRDAHVFLREIGMDPFTDCVRNFTAVTAACMMVPRRAFDAVGGFDERFAVAFNDVDLCLRLRQAGYRIVYTPHAVLYHAEGSTRGRGRQPVADERRLEERWLLTLDPDPYAGG